MLVSACLLGCECRYDGRANHDGELERGLRRDRVQAIPFCPEEEGGLSTPRPPAWIETTDASDVVDGRDRVVTEEGDDVTEQFALGARKALEVCREHGIVRAFLKERSPSCGVKHTHVNDELCSGPGVTSELLARNGIQIIGVEGRRT